MRSQVQVLPGPLDPSAAGGPGEPFGGVAQLGERVLCKHEVIGSIPFASTSPRVLAARGGGEPGTGGALSLQTSRSGQEVAAVPRPRANADPGCRVPPWGRMTGSWTCEEEEVTEKARTGPAGRQQCRCAGTGLGDRVNASSKPPVFAGRRGGARMDPNTDGEPPTSRWVLGSSEIKRLKGIWWMPWH